MSAEVVEGSFRDPAGFVFTKGGVLYRQVNSEFAEHYDLLLSSGLYEALTRRGLLVAHQEVDPALAARGGAHRVLQPALVPFVSYPYEWSFSQLKAAALLTLKMQQMAMDHGMSLRDANAYNIQFVDGRPVLIDTLSFERYEEGPPWVAYRQFCQHFLAPLALVSLVDIRLSQLLRVHIDGVPLDLTATLLPKRTKLRPSLALHLHQHARSQQRHAGDPSSTGKGGVRVSERALRGLIESLGGAVRKLDWEPEASTWRDYYEGDSYTQDAFDHKKSLVRQFLETAGPATVWDLGANTGVFSRLAVEAGAMTVAFELDPSAVEVNQRRVEQEKLGGLLPLVLDLTNPSPGIGWANRERDQLDRRGPVDLVMALALVHHLAIGNNVPLERIAEYFAMLGRWLIVEFVPKSDPKTQVLLSSREDIFDDYTVEGFERAFQSAFSIRQEEAVKGSDRVLFLMERR